MWVISGGRVGSLCCAFELGFFDSLLFGSLCVNSLLSDGVSFVALDLGLDLDLFRLFFFF